MLKREWGAENNGKLPHLFIPNNTATLVPEFVVEDLSLGRNAALMPAFALGQNTLMMIIIIVHSFDGVSDLLILPSLSVTTLIRKFHLISLSTKQ